MARTTALLTAAAAGVAAGAALRRRRRVDLSGRVVLITGAGRGLGLLMAREFAARGCRLVICGRGQAELAAARDDLAVHGADVLAIGCDVTDREQVASLVARAVDRYGGIDVLVNNAGVIQVGPALDLSVEDFIGAVEVMQLAPIYLVYEALPHLRDAGNGRIVTITSIGGKVPVPHLLPYVTAKFGAVGFSQGLHAELARHGIAVTTVVPGLMRTGSHLRATFAGKQSREFTWFALAASLPLLSMDAERAARRIVDATVAGRAEVTTTPMAVLASRLAGLAPATTARVAGLAARALPAPTGQRRPLRAGGQVAAGAPSRVRGAFTTLGRRAADRFQPSARPQT